MQMVLTPNDLFSWNNKYSKYTIILSRLYTTTMDSLFISQLRTLTYSVHAAFWSCEGVVFLVLSSSSHLTTYHVFPLPLSGANWRSLSLLWGSGPPFSKMAPPFTGSAHTPFPGSNTLTASKIAAEVRCSWRSIATCWHLAAAGNLLHTVSLHHHEPPLLPSSGLWQEAWESTLHGVIAPPVQHRIESGWCTKVSWHLRAHRDQRILKVIL